MMSKPTLPSLGVLGAGLLHLPAKSRQRCLESRIAAVLPGEIGQPPVENCQPVFGEPIVPGGARKRVRSRLNHPKGAIGELQAGKYRRFRGVVQSLHVSLQPDSTGKVDCAASQNQHRENAAAPRHDSRYRREPHYLQGKQSEVSDSQRVALTHYRDTQHYAGDDQDLPESLLGAYRRETWRSFGGAFLPRFGLSWGGPLLR